MKRAKAAACPAAWAAWEWECNHLSSPPYEGGVSRVFCVTGWFSKPFPAGTDEFGSSVFTLGKKASPDDEAFFLPKLCQFADPFNSPLRNGASPRLAESDFWNQRSSLRIECWPDERRHLVEETSCSEPRRKSVHPGRPPLCVHHFEP